MIILLNSITLAIFDYNDRNSQSDLNFVIDNCNMAFSIVYTLESALRIIA
jgi:hypothetical protein